MVRQSMERSTGAVATHAADEHSLRAEVRSTISERWPVERHQVVTSRRDQQPHSLLIAVDDEEAAHLGGLLVPRDEASGREATEIAHFRAEHDGQQSETSI